MEKRGRQQYKKGIQKETRRSNKKISLNRKNQTPKRLQGKIRYWREKKKTLDQDGEEREAAREEREAPR